MTARKKVTIYTDGACSGNPGPGGWGAVLMCGPHRRELCGGEAETTNNRMEMMGVIQALGHLKEPCDILLCSDSKYVIQGITEWVEGWAKRGWKTADKKPVKNVDLWQALVAATAPHTIRWQWVKGHASDAHNNRADELAREGITKIGR